MDFREKLSRGTVLFDGAMGTYYAEKYSRKTDGCELANLTHPADVKAVHLEYLRAGCDAVKTNTFGASSAPLDFGDGTPLLIVDAGWRLANEAAAEFGAAVFADIGPITPAKGAEEKAELYFPVVDRFLDLGAVNFLFETFPTAAVLPALCRRVKERAPEGFIICSFAVMPDGFTRSGALGARLYEDMCRDENTDAVGFNCVSGPSHLLKYIQSIPGGSKPLSVMPNAGYPSVVGGRTYFERNAEYFAAVLSSIASHGAAIVGGCCGSTPEYIEASRRALRRAPEEPDVAYAASAPEETSELPNNFWDKLASGQKVVAVELDPPVNSDIRTFLSGARALRDAGADAITLADCPVSRPRADSSLLACKLKRELDIDPIPHMTCRDRNLNATKALLLGLNIEGVRNVLVVTGDPIPTSDRDEVKSVYNFNSPMLSSFIRDLSPELSHGSFTVYTALNVNAANFDAHLSYARKKLEHGSAGFFTQPVHSQRALDNLKRAREELPPCKLLGGIMPIVSYRNACFMNSEIPGISVSEDIVERYRDLDREQAGDLAVELTVSFARAMDSYVDGYYMITPFQRTDLCARILKEIR